MSDYCKEVAPEYMQRTDENFYAYLLTAGDDFEYERPQNRPQLTQQTLKEIENGKSYQRKRPSNDETWNTWSKEKQETVGAQLEKGGLYIECEPGPLRSEPGLVGIWQQQPSGGWRQIGIELSLPLLNISQEAADNSRNYVGQNYKKYGIREAWRIHSDTRRFLSWVMYRPGEMHVWSGRGRSFPLTSPSGIGRYMRIYGGCGVGSERTCRCFLWDKKQSPYKSAFYTPEETAYLVESRASFYDLLDCDILYANDEIRELLNVPVADYMFDCQHAEYPPCVYVHENDMPSPEQLFRAFGERCFEAMSYPSVPEFRPFNKVSNVLGKLLDDESRCPYVDPEEIFPHLLDDFLIKFRIAKEYGSKRDEYIRWEEKGGLDKATGIYVRLKKWVRMCGLSGKYYNDVHYGWVMSLMTDENLHLCYNESFDRYKDGDVEDYADRAMLTFLAARDGLLGDTDQFCNRSDDVVFQIINRPVLTKTSGKELEYIVDHYVLPTREKKKPEPKLKLRLELFTETDRATLKTALEIMDMTLDEFESMTEEFLNKKYSETIEKAHASGGDVAEQVGDAKIAHHELTRLRKKYMI